jgi:pSer/pThr/pTyr-binding forkhead associated (FHA) protein
MKNKILAIRLEYQNRIIYETTSAEITEIFSIGRADDCNWIIPVEDVLASSHHATITLKKNRLCICDTGSRNGIFIKGERVSERILQPGDAIAVGDCLLKVEEARPRTEKGVSRIQLLSGDGAGKSYRLDNHHCVIGSAPGCDIPLMNQLVSRKHAEIEIRNDGCWITDSGGKNGTFINGTKLKSGAERLLKDSDIISIAQFDLKYLDHSVTHTQSRLWYSAAVAVLTTIVVFAGYYAYVQIHPSAFDLLQQARSAAAKSDFEQADELLKNARNSRGAEDCRLRTDELSRDIANWGETSRQWKLVCKLLAESRWTDAAHTLGAIDPARLNLWNWNDIDAADSRKQATLAKKLLDSFLTIQTVSSNDNLPLEVLRERAAGLDAVLAESLKSELDFLAPLNTQSAQLAGKLKSQIQANDQVETIVVRLKESPVPYDTIITELETIGKNTQGALRARVEKLVLPIIALRKSSGELRVAVQNISDMDFRKNLTAQLSIPPLEQCAVNPHIANLRRAQNEIHENLRDTTARLEQLYSALQRCGITEKKEIPPQITCFFNPGTLSEVFRCDILDKSLPPRGRTTPLGEYDRLLGMEPFYDFLYSLPMELDTAIYDDIGFSVEILKARDAFRRLEDMKSFLERPGNRIFSRGKLGGFHSFAIELLEKRSAWVRELAKRPMTDRVGLIANGIAVFLAGKGDLPVDTPEQFMKALKKYRAGLVKLDAEFSSASPERAIQIRDEILSHGIPGDPLVRKMWSKRR